MKISVVIISTILTLSVFIPFLLFIYNGTHNTSNTKKHITLFLKENGLIYSLKEIWRKNFIGISDDNKILTYLTSKGEEFISANVNLADLKQCNIIKHYNKAKDNVVSLKSLELELVFRASANKNILIPFFDIDEDLSEDFEIQRIAKWHDLISKSIPSQTITKKAS